MKRLVLLMFSLWWAFPAWSQVVGVEVYRGEIFLVEEFPVRKGPNELFLKARVEESALQIVPLKTEIVGFQTKEANPRSELAQRLQDLEKQKATLLSQKEALEEKMSLLKEILKNKSELPEPSFLKQYFGLFDELRTDSQQLEERLRELEGEISQLKNCVSLKRVTVLEIQARDTGRVRVRYQAPGIVEVKEDYRVELRPEARRLFLSGQAVLKQRSGEEWERVTLSFYPRSRVLASLSPPPFEPWIIEGPPPKPLALVKGKLKALATRLPHPKREQPPSGLWERVTLEGVRLPCGRSVLFTLLTKELSPQRILLEVPVYAVSQAYLRADLIPRESIPETWASFYVDGVYLGRARLGPLFPGREARLYFGQADLLEVKREILKDTSGHPFFSQGREVIEKVFRTTLINHYPRSFEVEVIDRLPIPKKKEIKVKAKADPPWQKMEANGRITWSFSLAPEEMIQITLSIKITRPSQP